MYYYSDDGSIFESKIQALNYGKKHKQKINFYYFDDVFSSCDWKNEPENTLDYYYTEQAQRIRDTYDYVILCYSGGYDSTNILETFHYNNIKLDKIVVVGAFSQDSEYGVDENHNGEIYHNVHPYIKDLGLESITQFCDYTKYFDDVINFSLFQDNQTPWMDRVGGWFSPHNWFWRDIHKYIVPKQFENKRVALIFGRDKPSLFYNEETSFPKLGILNSFCFSDVACNSYGNIMNVNAIERVNFYWDPKFPVILMKQLHLLKRVYDINRKTAYDSKTGHLLYQNMTINDIVYNLKRPLKFKSPKSKSKILSLRDSYFSEKKNSEIFNHYKKGINEILTTVSHEDIVPIYSKFYDIV